MDLNNLIKGIGIKQKGENKALDRYLENSNKNKEKLENLENLLFRFPEIVNDRTNPSLLGEDGIENYYNWVYKNINDFDIDIKNLDILDKKDLPVYDVIKDDYETNKKFGLFLSALINKNIKNGEEIQLNLPIPVNYLFYKLENAKAHVNIAGYELGSKAKNSKIYAEEARDYAGEDIEGCELHVNIAENYLGDKAKNSKVYAEKAGEFAGLDIEECELHVGIASKSLGYRAKDSKIYAEAAGDSAGRYMNNCELHVKKSYNSLGKDAKNSKIYAEEAGMYAGKDMKGCELHVKKADYILGIRAENSKIYVEEAGNGAGSSMKDSELYIYKLEGKLDESCLTGNNKVYLGKESYKKFPEYRRKVKIWKEKT